MKIDKIKEVKKVYSRINNKQNNKYSKSPFFAKVMDKLSDKKIKP